MLRLSGAALAGGAVTGPTLAQDTPPAAPALVGSRRPRNVILMISDGMSMGVPGMAEMLSQQTRHRGTVWTRLLRDRTAAQGLSATASLSSPVTDSSAASSAWGSGRRVANGAVNTYPDGTQLTPIAVMAKARGMRTGLITTDHICGGTPSGFAACQPSRGMRDEIALDYLDRVDVLLGGGRNSFLDRHRKDKVDLIERYRSADYACVDHRTAVVDAGKKLLGLYAGDVLPFTIDQLQNEQQRQDVPTLAEMTGLGLRSLNESPQGFFLMIEGARIDHAAHANDAAAMLHEQLAFDDAVAVALEYTKAQGDTLLVITSDHGNSNPGLNGMGSRYKSSAECFARLAGFQASFPVVMQALAREKKAGADSAAAARQTIQAMLGIELSDAEAAVVGQAVLENDLPEELAHHHRNKVGVLGQVIGNYIGVGWTSVSHTADHVLLSAVGPGSGDFACLQHHTEVHDLFADLLKLDSSNPAYDDAAA
jgi:alkaline phosphatase